MKKRHQQKLVVLSIALLFLFNIPLIFMFNHVESFFGFPVLYFFIFLIWAISILISYIILNRFYE
ncbi:hypothetical protein FHK87_23845 [Aquimarina algicola]|uniref:DUF3311 domain-containing protein n=1 Tax=Aquimarina algicola TaxID=2589995 RepID=A0A504IVR7_9FLAO|nr:hypothetical protein FHK87_23845 [Aquimarina algicola]